MNNNVIQHYQESTSSLVTFCLSDPRIDPILPLVWFNTMFDNYSYPSQELPQIPNSLHMTTTKRSNHMYTCSNKHTPLIFLGSPFRILPLYCLNKCLF